MSERSGCGRTDRSSVRLRIAYDAMMCDASICGYRVRLCDCAMCKRAVWSTCPMVGRGPMECHAKKMRGGEQCHQPTTEDGRRTTTDGRTTATDDCDGRRRIRTHSGVAIPDVE